MGANQAREIDACLRDGGVVVAASDRAARAIAGAYHRARLSEGRKAWPAPEVVSWQRFALEQWTRRTEESRPEDSRLVLNPIQERALWTEIVAAGGHAAATLPASRHRLALMAMEAHSLLCSYASRMLDERARREWGNDAGAFSEWLSSFDEACHAADAVSEHRVPLELISLLTRDARARTPLLLAGFDRVLPVQRELLAAWGEWRLVDDGEERGATHFYAARDTESELTACGIWCRMRLAEDPHARLLVVTQDVGTRRGEIERTLLDIFGAGSSRQFEFSLGVPLGEIGVARSAVMLLRWLDGALEEHELDWLLAVGHSAHAGDSAALLARMRDVRRRRLQRTQWTLRAFLQQFAKPAAPVAWAERLRAAQQRLQAAAQRRRSPLDWAELAPRLLAEIGWPGESMGSSAEFQAARRLQQVMDLCGSLGFDGRQISWKEFLADLERVLAETLFSAESQDAPILIAGPSESAGLTADALWFLGASEDAWPARGSLHPLLPASVQREARMPHASAQLDWDLARMITARVAGAAPHVWFSYARQIDGVDLRPSRIVTQVAGLPESLPMHLIASPAPPPLTVRRTDDDQIPLPPLEGARELSDSGGDQPGDAVPGHAVRGGAKLLTMQSQCAFKAFATGRLGAEDWELAEAGLTAAVRGKLLHAVMHGIWGGPPAGKRTLDELLRVVDRAEFVAGHVERAIRDELPESVREQMPQRYVDLEARRLTRLVSQWLDYEAARMPFTVMGTELNTKTEIGALHFDLRLDRIDRLSDGTMLVVDYKTGAVSPTLWNVPRPDDVQLPLYGGFALEEGSELGGLVFAKIRAGDVCFAGRLRDAGATLGTALKNSASLRKNQFEEKHLAEWREEILRLARDYGNGRADVDPRDPNVTCERCGLQALCRINETLVVMEEEEAEDADE